MESLKKYNHSMMKGPKLERRNAKKNIGYDPDHGDRYDGDTSSSGEWQPTHQCQGDPFRVDGITSLAEMNNIFRYLGLTGASSLGIPQAAWDQQKLNTAIRAQSGIPEHDDVESPSLSPKARSPDSLVPQLALNESFASSRKVGAFLQRSQGTSFARFGSEPVTYLEEPAKNSYHGLDERKLSPSGPQGSSLGHVKSSPARRLSLDSADSPPPRQVLTRLHSDQISLLSDGASFIGRSQTHLGSKFGDRKHTDREGPSLRDQAEPAFNRTLEASINRNSLGGADFASPVSRSAGGKNLAQSVWRSNKELEKMYDAEGMPFSRQSRVVSPSLDPSPLRTSSTQEHSKLASGLKVLGGRSLVTEAEEMRTMTRETHCDNVRMPSDKEAELHKVCLKEEPNTSRNETQYTRESVDDRARLSAVGGRDIVRVAGSNDPVKAGEDTTNPERGDKDKNVLTVEVEAEHVVQLNLNKIAQHPLLTPNSLPAPSQDPLQQSPISLVFPWTKGETLGSGSFGTVFEAVDSNGMLFAVKEVSLTDTSKQAKQCISQLEQEIKLLSQFKHDNIVQYFGTEMADGKLYIFLELVSKGSLASMCKRYKLSSSQVSAYTRQILKGLKYLHDRHIVHRDIKCANILIDDRGICKLADFGMATQISSLDQLKSTKGSAYWMAPEVIDPKKTYWLPADIWSLGCTVLELSTGHPPFGDMEWYRVLWKVGHGESPPIPDTCSNNAQDFLRLCFEVNPDKRPTVTMLLDHPFVRQEGGSTPMTTPVNSGQLNPAIVANLNTITEEISSELAKDS